MRLELDEVRRYTGPNLLWEHPGAVVDVFIEGINADEVAQKWQGWMQRCLEAFAWAEQLTTYRLHAEGASFAISAPFDALYTACDLAELAWDCCVNELQGEAETKLDWHARIQELKLDLAKELNPALMALMAEAKDNGVICLTDDDEVSLGIGPKSQVWPIAELPDASIIDWSQFGHIPTAYITGTNGKSTSVRLAAEIAKAAGINAGVTSTDFIKVGDEIIDTGDYSGPGGARMLLRDRRTQMAFLEVARGGILRRGLPVDSVSAAMITNVASDHLGQYGINTVEELAEAKFVVAKGLDAKGILVVNADNELVVKQALKSDKTLCWYSLDEDNPHIQKQIQTGGRAVFVRAGSVIYQANGLFDDFGRIQDMPMTFNGAATHNIKNILGVVGLCVALRLPYDAIRQGLVAFESSAEDNPGRGNAMEVQGRKIIVDFAHNEHSVKAVVAMVKQMPAQNRIVMFSHGGDRSDQDIKNLSLAVTELDASCYIVAEIESYLRGRELGEIPTLVESCLNQAGIDSANIKSVNNPIDGAKLALKQSSVGDILLLFVLDQREEVQEFLTSRV